MSSLSRCPDYDIPIPRSDQMSPMSRFPDVPIFRSPDQPITGSPDLFGSFDTSIKPFKIDEYFPSQAPVFVWRPHSMPKWRNWQTRMVQVHVLARVWGFESLLRHHVDSKDF